MEQKIDVVEENFCRVQIQDLIVDVIQVCVLCDASEKVPGATWSEKPYKIEKESQ